jgi:hypothetical protein
MRRRRPFTQAETAEIWDRIAAGHSPAAVAAVFGRYPSAIRALQQSTGGVRPLGRCRREGSLDLAEREEISRGLAAQFRFEQSPPSCTVRHRRSPGRCNATAV